MKERCIPLEALDSRNEFIAYLKQKEGILISIRVIARMQISRKADYAEFSWNMASLENCEQLARLRATIPWPDSKADLLEREIKTCYDDGQKKEQMVKRKKKREKSTHVVEYLFLRNIYIFPWFQYASKNRGRKQDDYFFFVPFLYQEGGLNFINVNWNKLVVYTPGLVLNSCSVNI